MMIKTDLHMKSAGKVLYLCVRENGFTEWIPDGTELVSLPSAVSAEIIGVSNKYMKAAFEQGGSNG